MSVRRRLLLALVGLALAAITLVGLGVLALAQIGAQRSAEAELEDRLLALGAVAASVDSFEAFGPALGRLGQAFDLNDARLVVISEDGTVSENRRGRPPRLELTDEQRQSALSGSPIVVSQGRRVVGLLHLDESPTRGPLAGRDVGILVEQRVAPVAGEARVWFLVSAGLVLALAVGAAAWLSNRFTRPLRTIEEATTRIAGGALDTRVVLDRDDELGQLGDAVNRMAADLEHSRAAEQEFLMSVSHDLRTPLTAIQGYGEALRDGAAPDPAQAGEVITTHARRLGRLVGDLLDLARLSGNQFQLELGTVDAAPIVRRTVEGLLPAAAEHGLAIDMEAADPGPPGALVHVDPDRLSQVLANLIENGIKFAEHRIVVTVTRRDTAGNTVTRRDTAGNTVTRRGTVTAGDTVTRRDTVTAGGTEATVSIMVDDDGPGIPAEDLPHVFERLYVTTQAPRRAENSSGLGLAIVHELVAAMGGRVSAGPRPGGGTRMTVTFPAGSAGRE